MSTINEFVSILHESNLSFLAVGLLFMILYWLLEAYMLQSLIRHDYPEESFGHSFTLTMIGQYYNLDQFRALPADSRFSFSK